MFVQALAEYADTYLSDELSNEAWEEKPVPFFVTFDAAGTFLSIVPHNEQAVRGKKTVSIPAPLPVPRSPVLRNAGLHPRLAVDDIRYVLGAGPWTLKDQEQNNRERNEAFIGLLNKAACASADEGLGAAAAFYSRPDQVAAAHTALKEAKAGSLVALALHNEPLVRRAAVKSYWSNHYAAIATGRIAKGGDAECLICGIIGPIAPTHEKIKGLTSLGGQAAGVSLMSFDKEAFRSYGWEQNANSPVSANRAMAYVLALNDLLRRDGNHRRDIGGVGFIFWTKEKTEFDPMAILESPPTPDQIQRMLDLNPTANPDPNKFYMAGIAANGGRMLIRYWVTETLSQVKGNVANWFEGLQVADVFTGKLSEPVKLWRLLHAIDREGEPPADRALALIRRAIEGPSQPLGYHMLAAALARLRVSSTNRLDPARAGLIRLCLNDITQSRNKGATYMTASLDTGQKHEAYLCGRLMAVYEGLQYSASGDVNQTVADRYFTLASTYPSQAFPRLEDLGNKHLRKLRRDNYGAMVRIEQEIDGLHLEIEQASGYQFPKALDLDGQGRFALGYHHQRAHQMAQAQTKKKAKTDQQNSEQNEEKQS